MQNQRDPHIDSQTINSYQQDGVVLLKGVFRPWIESLAAGVSELMANPSEYGHARTVVPKDAPPRSFRIIATGRGSLTLNALSCIRRRRKSPQR